MNLSKNIDIYCERLDFSFWAEPLNAITNLSFALAGLWGLYLYKQNASRWTKIFGILAIIVGIGSFLFHTFGTVWAMLLDVAPILIFMCSFMYFCSFYILRLTKKISLTLAFVFLLVGGILNLLLPQDFMNGSSGYIHALGVLFVFSFLKIGDLYKVRKEFVFSTLIFGLSLYFRAIDLDYCSVNSFGTHFLWHILNGVLLAILIFITAKVDKSLK